LFEIENKVIKVNKFLTIRTFKKLLIYRWNISNKWPGLYDANDRMRYKDNTLLKDTGYKFVCMWIIDSDKEFKISNEDLLKLKSGASKKVIIKEFRSQLKKHCGLGNDAILTNENM
jgi:hypothetical protein